MFTRGRDVAAGQSPDPSASRAINQSVGFISEPARIAQRASGASDTIDGVIPSATVVNWLDKHQGVASAFLTAVLVVVTIYYAVQNRRMVLEMERARKLAVEQRKLDEHREQLRELRLLTDDATCALSDLWRVVGTFVSAIPRGNPPVARRSPIESRDPDPKEFIEVYDRLRRAHLHLMNRVEWSDTFHIPVGRALSDTQAAYNAIVYEDPHDVRDRESEQAILKASASASRGLRDLQETSPARFAPLRMPDSRYSVLVVMTVRQRGLRADEILAALRSDRGQHGTIIGPGDDGRVMITDDEGSRGEGRARLVASLDGLAADWRDYFQVEPESDFERESWDRREQASREPRNACISA